MTYEIRHNPQFNSTEVYFDGKPSESVRDALKALKFRWHSVKRCWYGYASEPSTAEAITAASTEEEPTAVVGEGYMGGGAVYGSKSHKHLYGSDLSAAIRADLRKAGIKGVTVKCHSYSGGQSITATVKVLPADLIPYEQFRESYRILGSQAWIYLSDSEYIHCDRYWGADAAEQRRILEAAAAYEYERMTTREQTLHSIGRVDWLTESAAEKLKAIDSIIAAYRFDESNSMVDYYHTNFYYDLCLKPVMA